MTKTPRAASKAPAGHCSNAPRTSPTPRRSRSKRLRAAGGEVWRAYTLNEALRAIFQPGLSIDDVDMLLERFISRAHRSRLQPFVRLAATIARHRDGILAAIALGVTNPRAEALNNKARLIVRRAYGFHSPPPHSH